jgi:GNAT superfamily N-acetyltransferase
MSTPRLIISIEDAASADARQAVYSLMDDEALRLGSPLEKRRFCAVLRNEVGAIEGGIVAVCYSQWLGIDALAVAPQQRGRGYGGSLLRHAEAWGRDCSCRDVWLATIGADTRRFYERQATGCSRSCRTFRGGCRVFS